MRARYKGPSGTGILELPDDATVEAVFSELRTKTGISSFTLKYGPPMAMKSLDLSQRDQGAKSLGLHGETLTIVPDEARPVSPVPQPKTEDTALLSDTQAQRQPERQTTKSPEDIHVPWPEREGTICKEPTF